MIVVTGEALIDLIEDDGALSSHMGGGPFNTAVALGRLGVQVGFLGRLSNDRFGQLLAARFAESGVDDSYTMLSAAPTPLALIHQTADGDPLRPELLHDRHDQGAPLARAAARSRTRRVRRLRARRPARSRD